MPGRILIADAASSNRILLRARLAEGQYAVTDAATGEDVIEAARRDAPDLVIADEALADMTGAALCRRMKADAVLARIPLILLTRNGDGASRLAALDAGADEFLAKPVDEVTLMARVRSIMRAKETQDAVDRRRVTVAELGFSEAPDAYAPAARLAFVGRDPATAEGWKDGLRGLVRSPVEVLDPKGALAAAVSTPAPDLFLIEADLARPGEGLRLLCELRSRAATRYAAFLVLHRRGDGDSAAMALDLGASDIVAEGFLPAELAIRIRTQLRRKADADRLRASVEDGLRLAVTDPLTGLYNRRYALSHLGRVAERAAASARPFAVMVADLDRFKSINDTWGHAAGDTVLVEIAHRLRDNLRAVDMVARIGGEEFLITMPDTDEDTAELAADRLRRVTQGSPVTLRDGRTRVTATISIGVAVANAPGAEGSADLVDRADRALRASKAEGRNQVTLSRPAA